MTKKIILPLIAIIFLSSCANKFSLTKRKYTKGYYFASSKNNFSSKKENENKITTVKDLPIKNSNLQVETTANREIIKTNTSEFVKLAVPSLKINDPIKSLQILTASTDVKNNFEIKPKIQPVVEKQNYLGVINKKGSSDSNLILLIILCFLWWLNLIAVYIKDGKTITLNFWITLLLNFTFIGGIIFSLLVVLDVVDLK